MKKLMTIYLPVVLWIILIAPILSFADTTGGNGAGGTTGGNNPGSGVVTIPDPLNNSINSIPSLITTVIDSAVIPIGSILAVLMIMYAGFLFVTARGNPVQIAKARDALLYACIGAAILLGAKLLAAAVKNTVEQLK